MIKNDYLPTKCWFDGGKLMRGYFCYDECAESPREWDNLSVIVNASKYNLCGRHDVKTNDIEGWLIRETGINEEWYQRNYKRYGGIEGLIEKFRKEKCAAFSYITVYDHSGISVYCGYERGWDNTIAGFAYISKDNEEVKAYRKGHSKKETEEWADKMLECEIHVLNQWVNGNVYGCVTEEYNFEENEWDSYSGDSCWNYFLDDTTCESEEKDALDIIREFAGRDTKLYDMDVIEQALEDNTIDVLLGQKVFEFMEVAQ